MSDLGEIRLYNVQLHEFSNEETESQDSYMICPEHFN